MARSNKLKIESPIEELTVTEFSALRSGYLDKEGLISNSEWTNSVKAKSNQLPIDRSDPMPMDFATNASFGIS